MLRVGGSALLRVAVEESRAVERGEEPLVRIDDERVGRARCPRTGHGRSVPRARLLRRRRRRGTRLRAGPPTPPAMRGRPRCRDSSSPRSPTTANSSRSLSSPSEASTRSSAAPLKRPSVADVDDDHLDVHHRCRGLDRRVRLGARRDRPSWLAAALGRPLVAWRRRRRAGAVARRDERREVADRAALHEDAAGAGRQARRARPARPAPGSRRRPRRLPRASCRRRSTRHRRRDRTASTLRSGRTG